VVAGSADSLLALADLWATAATLWRIPAVLG